MVHDAYDPPLNKINPIYPQNPNKFEYMSFAQQFAERAQR